MIYLVISYSFYIKYLHDWVGETYTSKISDMGNCYLTYAYTQPFVASIIFNFLFIFFWGGGKIGSWLNEDSWRYKLLFVKHYCNLQVQLTLRWNVTNCLVSCRCTNWSYNYPPWCHQDKVNGSSKLLSCFLFLILFLRQPSSYIHTHNLMYMDNLEANQ